MFEATRAIQQAEVGAAKTMIERSADRFGLRPERLAADSAYGSASSLNWMVEEQGIAPHIPVFDRSQRSDGTFSRDDFRFDEDADVYICPAGKTLTTTGALVTTERLSISASMQIAKTPQTKAAFHHGSTVPYGIAVRTITATRAQNISLLSKSN